MVAIDIETDDDDVESIAVFEGRIPSRWERSVIRRRKYMLNLINVPDRYADLEFLGEYASFLTRLAVSSPNVVDGHPILQLNALEELALQLSANASLDLSSMPNLMDFGGELQGFESVLSAPKLKTARFQNAGQGILPVIASPLESLELVDMKSTPLKPRFSEPAKLRSLAVTAAKRIDVAEFEELSGLEVLELADCTEIVGLSALASLGRLRVLVLENCRLLDEPDILLSLEVERIAIVDKNPFDLAFRERAAKASAKWVYLGTARRVPRATRSS
ncbi:hypothetical protein ELQ90_16425 [Labedella phragmitis]|uniref:Leucine-rich repeat domain-containing protein n=1 Tax=Labedella phragmitis TaxID=2498849 RepID=A0A3S4D7E8_9MICO|nr:hypothetical protein [Labedella phragmitis]RWZ45977.1 hypothetical protein ELQ90_16425 [Labedella phragmitis]